jgi:plastocyanin
MRPFHAVVLCAVVATACGGGGGGTESPVVASLAISPGVIDSLFSRGLTVQLSVQAKDAAGNVINNAPLSFNSSSQSVATVSTSGLITAQGDGKANITVTSGTASKAVEVNVRRKVNSITVTPATRTVAPAGTQALVVRAFDAQNNEIASAGTPTFVSSNNAAATVNGAGVVTAVAAGTSTITATLVTVDGTRTATSVITVGAVTFPNTAAVTLGASSFDPNSVDIAQGGSVTWTNSSGQLHNIMFAAASIADVNDHSSGSNTRTFTSAGTFSYQCNIHAGMTGSVIVH